MMCCKTPTIKELEKPPGVWCRHAVTGKGCGIYENRPPVCRSFYCHWMLNPHLGPEWKPDRAKFVLYGDAPSGGRQVIHVAVDPSFPDAWTKPPYFAAIKKWAADGAEQDRLLLVLVQIGARFIGVLPDRIVELGSLDPQVPLVLSRKRGPTGYTYEIRRSESVSDAKEPSDAIPSADWTSLP
jgi:hypothetical protein